MRVFRAKYTCDPPPHAERLARGGRTVVRWKGRTGRVEGVLRPSGKVSVEVADVWYYEFTDQHGDPKRRKGFPDKAATEALARREQTAADRVRAGLDAPTPAPGAGKALLDHAADYLEFLRSKGRAKNYVAEVGQHLGYVLAATGAVRADDLSEHAVTVAVAKLRKPPKGIGPTTVRAYVGSVKSFLAWLVRDRRAAANPLAGLVREVDRTDLRRRRRRLTDAEFERVLAAAVASRPKQYRAVQRPYGESRACVYLTAAYTGFRAEEVGTLHPEAFLLDGPVPRVVVSAAVAKNGKEAVIPVAPSVADRLRAFLAGKTPGKPVWPGRWWRKAAGMLADDLAACDPPIPYRDARGRYADFHALRRTFVGKLAAAGVDPKTAQAMARHSTITLTMDVYRDEAEMAEMAAAAAKIGTPPPG